MSIAVPQEFAAVLRTFVLDRAFAMEFPLIVEKSLKLAEVLDAGACSVSSQLSGVCRSQDASCQFLAAFRQQQPVMLPWSSLYC